VRAVQLDACVDDPGGHHIRVRGLRAPNEPDVGHAAGEDPQAAQGVYRAIFEISTRRTGISAKDLQRIMGFGSYKTAWSWLHKHLRICESLIRKGRFYKGSQPDCTTDFWIGLRAVQRGLSASASGLGYGKGPRRDRRNVGLSKNSVMEIVRCGAAA
jgi:hypothetical protein